MEIKGIPIPNAANGSREREYSDWEQVPQFLGTEKNPQLKKKKKQLA